MKTKALWCIVVLYCAVSPIVAAEPAFRFSKEVKAPLLQREELLAIPLDSEVFAATQESLADVRLHDNEGKSIPYLLRKRQTTRARAVRTTWPARDIAAQPLDDGGLEIIVRFAEDKKRPHPNGLTLVSPLRNFKQRVRVFTSTDGEPWEPAGEETVIFDYSRYMDVRSDSIPFPETGRRNFRIVIDDVTLEQESELLALTRRLQGAAEVDRTEQAVIDRRPFRIERIDFWREVHEERVTGDEKAVYPVDDFHVEEDRDKQRTLILVDTRRQPLTSLTIESPDRNFSRQAVVEVERTQGINRTWQRIGEGTLTRLDFRNLKREELAIGFSEARHRKYRLVIENRDSPPLQISGVKAEGNVYEILYLAGPDRHDQLLYGSDESERPAYDHAAIEELLGKGIQAMQAELGAEGPGVGQPSSLNWSKLFNSPLLLGGTVTILVIVLGWGLYKAVKRVDAMPGDENEG